MIICMVDIWLLLFSKLKMNKNNMLKPYTVHYRNFQNIRLENCFYASDAYEARTLAMEFNKYINCLLYTSPSPRDGRISRMPSSA